MGCRICGQKPDGAVSNMIIDVERIFPGMDNFERSIQVKNKGEVNIRLSYEIQSLTIMGQTYSITGENALTSEEIEQKISDEYPFKITIEKQDQSLMTGSGDGYFKVKVEWPFEGDDEKDTIWGEKAYEFYATHPGEKCIQLNLMLIASQLNE